MTTIEWTNNEIKILDQRELPEKLIYHTYSNYREIAFALEENIITGSGLRMYAAAIAIAVSASSMRIQTAQFNEELNSVISYFEKVCGANPSCSDVIIEIRAICEKGESADVVSQLTRYAESLREKLASSEDRVSSLLAEELSGNDSVLFCSASGTALASVGRGCIGGALDTLKEKGKNISLFCLENRPGFSGARLLAFDLQRKGYHPVILSDIQAHALFRKKTVQKVIINAECLSEDNRILCGCGSSMILSAAREFGIPVVCTVSRALYFSGAFDSSVEDAEGSVYDLALIKGTPVAPEGVKIHNYLYDVIDSGRFSTIIDDEGIRRQ